MNKDNKKVHIKVPRVPKNTPLCGKIPGDRGEYGNGEQEISKKEIFFNRAEALLTLSLAFCAGAYCLFGNKKGKNRNNRKRIKAEKAKE